METRGSLLCEERIAAQCLRKVKSLHNILFFWEDLESLRRKNRLASAYERGIATPWIIFRITTAVHFVKAFR
jgi:hypothetical protein